MMRVSTLAGLLLLGLACTPKATGSQHWKKACTHASTLGVELDVDECVANYATFPVEVADDIARCALRLDGPDDAHQKTLACAGDAARAFLEQRDRANAILERHGEAVGAFKQEHGKLPASLAELGADFDGRDPWGTALAYSPETATEGYELCSAGPDARHGTTDDLCRPQPFIYFQF